MLLELTYGQFIFITEAVEGNWAFTGLLDGITPVEVQKEDVVDYVLI